jgi:hypothetical protein
MNAAAIFSGILEYGTIELIIGLIVFVGWFAFDEIQYATNSVKRD